MIKKKFKTDKKWPRVAFVLRNPNWSKKMTRIENTDCEILKHLVTSSMKTQQNILLSLATLIGTRYTAARW